MDESTNKTTVNYFYNERGDYTISVNSKPIAICKGERDAKNIVDLIVKLQKFKEYVHERLDLMGIPPNPEPETNEITGCRIEGRLNIIENIVRVSKEINHLLLLIK